MSKYKAALEAIIKAWDEPHYGDQDARLDIMHDEIEKARALMPPPKPKGRPIRDGRWMCDKDNGYACDCDKPRGCTGRAPLGKIIRWEEVESQQSPLATKL